MEIIFVSLRTCLGVRGVFKVKILKFMRQENTPQRSYVSNLFLKHLNKKVIYLF